MARLSEKIGYGFGDMASSMFWKIFSFFLPFFYSNIFGLSLIDAGMLMLVTRVWDAVSDPMMGVICDRTHTRWGKYRPYLLWVALPFALCGVMLFMTPDTGYGFKLFWAYFTYILMMTCYTAINVPYGAMLDVVTTSSQEKTVFSSYRMFFSYAGSFMALLAWEPLCGLFNGTVRHASRVVQSQGLDSGHDGDRRGMLPVVSALFRHDARGCRFAVEGVGGQGFPHSDDQPSVVDHERCGDLQ